MFLFRFDSSQKSIITDIISYRIYPFQEWLFIDMFLLQSVSFAFSLGVWCDKRYVTAYLSRYILGPSWSQRDAGLPFSLQSIAITSCGIARNGSCDGPDWLGWRQAMDGPSWRHTVMASQAAGLTWTYNARSGKDRRLAQNPAHIPWMAYSASCPLQMGF